MILAYGGNKAGKGTYVWLEIDDVRGSHKRIRFLKKMLMSFCKNLVTLLTACFGFVLI